MKFSSEKLFHIGCVLSSASFALGQSTSVTSIFLPTDTDNYVLSVITADASAVTMQIKCPDDVLERHCGFGAGQEITQGESNFHYVISETDYQIDLSCAITSRVDATCMFTSTAEGEPSSRVLTTSYSGADLFKAATITAGLEKLESLATGEPGETSEPTSEPTETESSPSGTEESTTDTLETGSVNGESASEQSTSSENSAIYLGSNSVIVFGFTITISLLVTLFIL